MSAGLKALRNMVTTQGTIRTDVVRFAAVLHGGHCLDHGFANFHGVGMCGLFHPVGSCVTRTTLNRVDGGVGDHLQHLFGFLANVLHAAMAWNLIADIAQ